MSWPQIDYEPYRQTRRTTVYDFERGLLFDRGRFIKILEPGYYNYWWTRKRAIVKVDLRAHSMVVASQEILSADGIPVRISLATVVAIQDPRKFFETTLNAQNAFYVDLQVAMREMVSTRSLEQLVSERQALGADLESSCRAAGEKYGYRLESVSVRDVTVSGEIKKAYGDVFKARKSGEAMLERARGESAALRNLANAARLIADQPSLLQLRALQALAESPGSTLVFGADGTVIPKPASKPAPSKQEPQESSE